MNNIIVFTHQWNSCDEKRRKQKPEK